MASSSKHIGFAEDTADLAPSMKALLSREHANIIDLVDNLRQSGLSHVLHLPQLVVCGDQSSGKSSVLEAISQIPFPRKENLCTRFATEIILRNSETASVSAKITPHESSSKEERAAMAGFHRSIEDVGDFPKVVEDATIAMGLDTTVNQDTKRTFSRDVLSVEICGPGRPQLTLVDLPGITHVDDESEDLSNVKLVKGLVQDYIKNDRTIILPVISAKNDYQNQTILTLCREVDPTGSRTLGIVTKPDFLRPGSENEQTWIKLIKNQGKIRFELGWHVLKNREDGQQHYTFEQRNDAERTFFSVDRWRSLNRDNIGIDNLRTRLSVLLGKHLKKELPALKKELEAKLTDTSTSLSNLSEKRTTVFEQRQFLTKVSMNMNDIVKSAVNGYYDHAFFGTVDVDAAIDESTNMHRLRANVHNLNFEFVGHMQRFGRTYAIGTQANAQSGAGHAFDAKDSDDESDDDITTDGSRPRSAASSTTSKTDASENEVDFGRPSKLTRSEAIDWVLRVLKRSRGRELPGTSNPLIIGQIFKEQSTSWKQIALAHVYRTASLCEAFVKQAMETSVPNEIRDQLWNLKIEGALQDALSKSKQELAKIIEDKDRHPITYNHYFTTTIQKMHQQKLRTAVQSLTRDVHTARAVKTGKPGPAYAFVEHIDPEKLEAKLNSVIEQDMDRFAAEQILDEQIAFYKDEAKYFIGAVTKQVIERHLVDTLPNNVLSPMTIAQFSDEEVTAIAAESDEVIAQREGLESLLQALEAGRARFRDILRGGGTR